MFPLSVRVLCYVGCFFRGCALWVVCMVPDFCICFFCVLCLSGPVCLIWIPGHSYVHWGAKQALVRPEGRQMGFSRTDATVWWIGIPGMLWSRVMPKIQRYARLDRPPGCAAVACWGQRPLPQGLPISYQGCKMGFPLTTVSLPGYHCSVA